MNIDTTTVGGLVGEIDGAGSFFTREDYMSLTQIVVHALNTSLKPASLFCFAELVRTMTTGQVGAFLQVVQSDHFAMFATSLSNGSVDRATVVESIAGLGKTVIVAKPPLALLDTYNKAVGTYKKIDIEVMEGYMMTVKAPDKFKAEGVIRCLMAVQNDTAFARYTELLRSTKLRFPNARCLTYASNPKVYFPACVEDFERVYASFKVVFFRKVTPDEIAFLACSIFYDQLAAVPDTQDPTEVLGKLAVGLLLEEREPRIIGNLDNPRLGEQLLELKAELNNDRLYRSNTDPVLDVNTERKIKGGSFFLTTALRFHDYPIMRIKESFELFSGYAAINGAISRVGEGDYNVFMYQNLNLKVEMIGSRDRMIRRSWLVDDDLNVKRSAEALYRMAYLCTQCKLDIISTIVTVGDTALFHKAYDSLMLRTDAYAIFFETMNHMHDCPLFVVAVRHGSLSLAGYAKLYSYPQLETHWDLFEKGGHDVVRLPCGADYTRMKCLIFDPSQLVSDIAAVDRALLDADRCAVRKWSVIADSEKFVPAKLLVNMIQQKTIALPDGIGLTLFVCNFRYAVYDKFRDFSRLSTWNTYVASICMYQTWERSGCNSYAGLLQREVRRRKLGNNIRRRQFAGKLSPYWFDFIKRLLQDYDHYAINVPNAYAELRESQFSDLRFALVRPSKVKKKHKGADSKQHSHELDNQIEIDRSLLNVSEDTIEI